MTQKQLLILIAGTFLLIAALQARPERWSVGYDEAIEVEAMRIMVDGVPMVLLAPETYPRGQSLRIIPEADGDTWLDIGDVNSRWRSARIVAQEGVGIGIVQPDALNVSGLNIASEGIDGTKHKIEIFLDNLVMVRADRGGLSFFGGETAPKPIISGDSAGNEALEELLSGLESLGLISRIK